jgi:hypothetical protein
MLFPQLCRYYEFMNTGCSIFRPIPASCRWRRSTTSPPGSPGPAWAFPPFPIPDSSFPTEPFRSTLSLLAIFYFFLLGPHVFFFFSHQFLVQSKMAKLNPPPPPTHLQYQYQVYSFSAVFSNGSYLLVTLVLVLSIFLLNFGCELNDSIHGYQLSFFFLLGPLTLRCSCMYFIHHCFFLSVSPHIQFTCSIYTPSYHSNLPYVFSPFPLSHIPKIKKPAWCGDRPDGKRAFCFLAFLAPLFCMHSFPHISVLSACLACL